MSVRQVPERLHPVVSMAADQLHAARETWNERSADDVRIRLGGTFLGGLLLGKVVKRVGR